MIYIVKTESVPEFIKIGYSKSKPIKRMKSLQTGCPHNIILLEVRKGSFIHEGILHGHMKEFRARGEWFLYTDESRSMLEGLFKKFNIRKCRKLLSDPKPRERKHDKVLTQLIINCLDNGMKTREAAKHLGVHKDTILRHKNIYSKIPINQDPPT